MGCSSSKAAADVDVFRGGGRTEPDELKTLTEELPSESLTPKMERRMTESVRRRDAIRGEAAEDLEDYTPCVVEKSEEAKNRIKEFIAKNELLKGVGAAQVQVLVDTFRHVSCKAGETIITEGEDGDLFYLVDSGRFDVFLKASGIDPVLSYGQGDAFGELALLYNSPRAASVKCINDGGLWCLDRKDFRNVTINSESSTFVEKDHFLKAVPIFSALTDQQRSILASYLEELVFTPGEYILTQSEAADALFFVKSGEVVCHTDDNGLKKELMRIREAGFFGESCLDDNAAVRKANVVAVTEVTVLKLTRQDFQEQLGGLSDLVNENFKRKVMAGLEINGTRLWPQLALEDQELLLSKLEEQAVAPEAEIITEGAPNDTFYIIKSGTVKVMKKTEGIFRSPRQLATLQPGQFFGERALLTSEPASATVKADHATVVYKCERETFTSVFGPVQELLDKEIARRDEMARRPIAPEWDELELRRILGVGTFGRVRLVYHRNGQKSYALKCMRKAQVVLMKQQAHILYEKEILSMMDHPFILKLVATYQDAGELYMLMDIALGGELFTLLSKKAPLPESQTRFYIAQVVSIFSYMHNMNVIYRDLKPENLLLDSEGYLKIVDFGFAKIVKDRTWTLCGTPEYLAPEIILNKGHSFGADWWCLGILAFECMTGFTPFMARDQMDGYRKILKCRVPWPNTIGPGAKEFIGKLIVADPTRRLGCLKQGSLHVRNADWFRGLSWKSLDARLLPAPYVPKIKSQVDDSNFDRYEDDTKIRFPQANFPKEMFKDFADVWV